MIYTLTLNPAIDKTVTVPGFTPGAVNRVTSLRQDVGGKGINVSKCLIQLGAETTAAGFFGGDAGRWMTNQLENAKIPVLAVAINGESRTNLKIVDGEKCQNTDINEPGPEISPEEMDALLVKLEDALQLGDILVLSGSLPKGVPVTLYRDLCFRFRKRNISVYLDADGDNFRQGITAAPDLVKPNEVELARFVGKTLEKEEELLAAATDLLNRGIGTVLLSLGAEGALLCRKEGCWRAKGLTVPVISTVGAGDSMVAAMAYAQEKNLPWSERLALAVAISAASVSCSGTQAPTREAIDDLLPQVQVEQLY